MKQKLIVSDKAPRRERSREQDGMQCLRGLSFFVCVPGFPCLSAVNPGMPTTLLIKDIRQEKSADGRPGASTAPVGLPLLTPAWASRTVSCHPEQQLIPKR